MIFIPALPTLLQLLPTPTRPAAVARRRRKKVVLGEVVAMRRDLVVVSK